MATVEKRIIGRADIIDFPEFGLTDVPVKVDTGAYGSAIYSANIVEYMVDGKKEISFQLPFSNGEEKSPVRCKDFKVKRVKSSSGHVEERYTISTTIVLFGQRIETSFSLADRSKMKYPVLLGRNVLRSRFIVDPVKKNLSHKEKINQ
ncbi:MAG: RimK/LysX family protein [Vicingaceae bacterium]